MLRTVFLVAALGVAGAVAAQPPKPHLERESAAAGASGWRCNVMSREEMLFCQAAKESPAKGVRNNLCESVSAEAIERCLVQQESQSSDPANEFRDPQDARAASG